MDSDGGLLTIQGTDCLKPQCTASRTKEHACSSAHSYQQIAAPRHSRSHLHGGGVRHSSKAGEEATGSGFFKVTCDAKQERSADM